MPSAEINGLTADKRLALRQTHVASRVADLEDWMRAERARLSRHNDVAKVMDYMLKRWPAFTRFLEDGRICLTNNAAERALRCVAVGRGNWTFCGSDRGGERATAAYTLMATAKLNDIDPEAWLADVLGHINDHPASRLDELLPWSGAASPPSVMSPSEPSVGAVNPDMKSCPSPLANSTPLCWPLRKIRSLPEPPDTPALV
jgi:hypothetical protein